MLSNEEKALLMKPPGYQIYRSIDPEQVEVDIAQMSTKYRWDVSRRLEEELGDEEVEVSEEEREKLNIIEGESRMWYNPENKVLHMNKKRVTDYKDNSYINMPMPIKDRRQQMAIRRNALKRLK